MVARREEGEYPLWSLTDEQQSTRPKSAQPFGLGRRRRLAALLARLIGLSSSPRQRLARHPAPLPTLLYEPQTWCTKNATTTPPTSAREPEWFGLALNVRQLD